MKGLRKSPSVSLGMLVILAIAGVTSVLVAWLPKREAAGIVFWLTSGRHEVAYQPVVAQWNEASRARRFGSQPSLAMTRMANRSFEQLMLSGFLSGTPVADLLESSDDTIPRAFLGPVEQVGFVDLTQRLREEGIYERFELRAFDPFTSRGHIFGLPRGVHPVLLAYRADIVEAAGIDLSQVETWEDYFRAMRPLMADNDGDGQPDRYLLSFNEVATNELTILMLQNGGVFFDDEELPDFANEKNAHVLATVVSWMTGPDRVAQTTTPNSHLRNPDGFALAVPMPDWLLSVWKMELPMLTGKLKLMPLPAWERGGRRTSTRGGSMIGINRRSPHAEAAWEIAKTLYTSREVAEQLYRETSIISPLKEFWGEAFYAEPDPYVSGQAAGLLYIEQAPHVPKRTSSPYAATAETYMIGAFLDLREYAEQHAVYDAEALKPVALRLLEEAQHSLRHLILRNTFLSPPTK
ncbi:ABC transporter substrate-binding protein [Cephaloticoccus capnophilus]|nr:extracellular solute-binding protein [Cephaloticoccus capnophilus]